MVDGRTEYLEQRKTLSGNTFVGECYVKEGLLHIRGTITLPAITAFSTLLFYVNGVSTKSGTCLLVTQSTSRQTYQIYTGGGSQAFSYGSVNIPAGNYCIDWVLQLS